MSIGRGFLSLQGNASYSLYLVHPFVLQAVGKVTMMLGLNHTWPGIIVIAATMPVASIILATAFHVAVEKPLSRWLSPAGTKSPRLRAEAT